MMHLLRPMKPLKSLLQQKQAPAWVKENHMGGGSSAWAKPPTLQTKPPTGTEVLPS